MADELVPTEDQSKMLGRPAGRPSTFKAEYIDKVRDLISRGVYAHAQIASALGIGRTTLWRWSKESPELEQELEVAKTVGEDKLIDALWKIGLGHTKGNPAALAMIGNNVYGWRSGTAGDGGNVYNIQNNVNLTYDKINVELQKYLDLMGVKNLNELQGEIVDAEIEPSK